MFFPFLRAFHRCSGQFCLFFSFAAFSAFLNTLKGKGVSFMEGPVGWHGKAPNAEQAAQALKELEG